MSNYSWIFDKRNNNLAVQINKLVNKILNFTEWDSYCLVSNALKVAQKYFVFIVSISDIWANNH